MHAPLVPRGKTAGRPSIVRSSAVQSSVRRRAGFGTLRNYIIELEAAKISRRAVLTTGNPIYDELRNFNWICCNID
jgi:hypothetical protein